LNQTSLTPTWNIVIRQRHRIHLEVTRRIRIRHKLRIQLLPVLPVRPLHLLNPLPPLRRLRPSRPPQPQWNKPPLLQPKQPLLRLLLLNAFPLITSTTVPQLLLTTVPQLLLNTESPLNVANLLNTKSPLNTTVLLSMALRMSILIKCLSMIHLILYLQQVLKLPRQPKFLV